MNSRAKQLTLLTILAVLVSLESKSQVNDTLKKGSLILNESENIRTLVNTYVAENSAKKTTEGYRVQILSESGNEAKKKAMEVKTAFLSQYSSYPAYLLFQTPNFKIRIGDFRTKLEAYQCLKQIQVNFPNGFVVKDDIQFPSLEN
jgi:hypothetical protein